MSRKLILGVLVFVAAFALVATASAQTTYTRNLTIGSSGSDVVALQNFLVSKGHLTLPAGVSAGYFGGLTKAALAKFQMAKGITPAVGYFGPVTRAAVSADTGSTPVTPVTGCPAGFVSTVYMGTSVCVPGTTSTTTTSTGGSNVEGTLDIKLAPSPANNSNIQTSVDVPVYGLEFKAKISDVTVDRADLQVKVMNGSSNENPATLINTVKAWDGSSVLKTWNVTSADFIKDTNDSSVYYLRLSGLGYVVPKDSTKTLTISFSTTGGIDSDRVVTVDGYQTNSVRAVSGLNVTSFYSIDGAGFTRTHTFKKPGASTLTLSADSNTPDATNWKISSTDGVQGVVLQTFNVKSETGDSKVTDVVVTTAGTVASTLYLYDGSTLVDSRTAAATTTFSNVSVAVAKDVIKTLTIKADYPSSVSTGSSASTTVSSVTYEKPNGSSATTTASGVSGETQRFYTNVAQFAFVSASAAVNNPVNTSTASSTVDGSFTFTVKPLGTSVTAFATSSFKIGVTQGSATEPSGITKAVTVTPNTTGDYAENSTYTVTVNFSAPYSGLSNGLQKFYLNRIDWVAGASSANQSWGLDDYKTNSVTVTK